MKKQNVRTLSLIVCTFTYLLVGAAIFDALESENEREQHQELISYFGRFQDVYNVSDSKMSQLKLKLKEYLPHRAGQQWKFAGAFYFATTVITTIGYGHSTPKTEVGKIFCMLYALAGIPLTLVMYQSVGERFNILVTFIIRNIKKCFKCKSSEVSQTTLVGVGMGLSGMVTFGGAYIFSQMEDWNYLNALYYCVISLTTVGFGDLVALQQDNVLDRSPGYVAFGLVYILFGLTVLAASFNLLVLRLLAMNTEDERRDEREAARRRATMIDGGLLNDGLLMNKRPNFRHSIFVPNSVDDQQSQASEEVKEDAGSVCSCSCYILGPKNREHYTATRGPTQVARLLATATPRSSSINPIEEQETEAPTLTRTWSKRSSL